MGCVCVYVQKVELRYWWEYDDEKTRIKNIFLKNTGSLVFRAWVKQPQTLFKWLKMNTNRRE